MENKPLPPRLEDAIAAGHELFRVGGPVDRARVSLRIFGDDLNPAEVTAMLNCPPTEARRKGELIADSKYRRVARTGCWFLNSAESNDLERQLMQLIQMTTSDLRIWQQLVARFDVDIFCGVFMDKWNRGFSLSPAATRALADRNLSIGFDIYGPA